MPDFAPSTLLVEPGAPPWALRLGLRLVKTFQNLFPTQPTRLWNTLWAELPDPSAWTGALAYVSDKSDVAVSTGGAWLLERTGGGSPPLAFTPDDFGAVGDGVADDSAAVQAADDAAFAAGYPAWATGRYRIAATVNLHAQWQGAFSPKEDVNHDIASIRSAFVVDSTATLNLMNGAAVRNIFVVRTGLTKAVSEADALAQIAAFAGRAFTAAGSDVWLEEVMAMGFAAFFLCSGHERPRVRGCYFDCTNGVEITQCFDVARVIENHAFPFYAVHQFSDINTGFRAGTAYSFHDTADGAIIVSNFAYGWATGFYFSNVFAQRVCGNIVDNIISRAAATNSVGFQTAATVNTATFTDNHSDSCNQNFLFAHTGGMVCGGMVACGQSIASQIWVGHAACVAFAVAMIAGGSSACITFEAGRTVLASFGVVQFSTGTRAGNAFAFNAADAALIDVRRVGLNGQPTVDNLSGIAYLRGFTLAQLNAISSAAVAGAGAVSFVTDATATLPAGLGAAVVGGGANKVPVYSDGAAWRIG